MRVDAAGGLSRVDLRPGGLGRWLEQYRRRFFAGSGGGLTPQSGNDFWNALNAGNNRGAWKSFGTTFTSDRLKVTFNMGDRNDSAWSGGVTALLFADTNGDNTYQWEGRIVPDSQSSPTPSDGWATWERIYNISADTTTGDGDPVIGEEVGFSVVSLVDSGENMAFDGPLTIKTEVVGVTAGTSSIIYEAWCQNTGVGNEWYPFGIAIGRPLWDN